MTSRGKMRSRYIRFDLFLPKIKRPRSLYSPSTPLPLLLAPTTSSNFVSNLVAATQPIDGNEINFRSRSSKTYLKPAKEGGREGGGGERRKGEEMSPNFEEGRARASLSLSLSRIARLKREIGRRERSVANPSSASLSLSLSPPSACPSLGRIRERENREVWHSHIEAAAAERREDKPVMRFGA